MNVYMVYKDKNDLLLPDKHAVFGNIKLVVHNLVEQVCRPFI